MLYFIIQIIKLRITLRITNGHAAYYRANYLLKRNATNWSRRKAVIPFPESMYKTFLPIQAAEMADDKHSWVFPLPDKPSKWSYLSGWVSRFQSYSYLCFLKVRSWSHWFSLIIDFQVILFLINTFAWNFIKGHANSTEGCYELRPTRKKMTDDTLIHLQTIFEQITRQYH